MIPPWLARHIDTVTGTTRDYRTNAKVGRCRRCDVKVLRGLDGDPIGVPADADVRPLPSTMHETKARTLGRRTYRLRGMTPRTMTLDCRGPHEIVTQPIGTRDASGDVLVVVEHRCYEPIL